MDPPTNKRMLDPLPKKHLEQQTKQKIDPPLSYVLFMAMLILSASVEGFSD